MQLNISASGFLNKTDQMRFFKEYCTETGTGEKSGKVLVNAVLKKTRQRLNTEQKIRRTLDQTLRTNSKYTFVKTANYRGVFAKDFWSQTSPADFIKNIDKLIESGQIITNDGNCVVSRLKWNNSDVTVTRYKTKGFVNSLRQTIGNSIAKSAWLNAHRARLLKLPAPAPLAFIEFRKSGLVKSSCFVTGHTEGQQLPDSFCGSNAPVPDK